MKAFTNLLVHRIITESTDTEIAIVLQHALCWTLIKSIPTDNGLGSKCDFDPQFSRKILSWTNVNYTYSDLSIGTYFFIPILSIEKIQ